VKIVCLVKQVPRGDAIEFDQETKSLKREGVPLELNGLDRHAVAAAVRLREQVGGEVIAMTMGPPQAADALRECLALGADRAIHLSDRVFAVADTLGTSRTLALAIEKEGGVDLVLCGRKTLDSETWQVPPEVAAFLGIPQLTSVVELHADDDRLLALREGDDGIDEYELAPPALVSVARVDPPPGPSNSLLLGGSERLDVWTANDLVPDVRPNDKRFGQTGSPTRVLAVRDVTPERAGEVAASAGEAAATIRALLAERARPPSAWDKPERLGEQPGRSYDCWSIVETRGGRASRHGLELLGKGRELAGKLGGKNVALVLGHGIEEATRQALAHGAERAVALDDATLEPYAPEPWVSALREVVERRRPHVLLIPASSNGRDYGPRLAGELGLGMTGDCVDLGIDRGGRLIQHKPAYGGNIVSVIMGATTPQLATVRPRMFEPVEPHAPDGSFERAAIEVAAEPVVRFRRNVEPSDAWRLDEADIVIGVGSAVGADGLVRIEQLAMQLRAVVGGDHGACSSGLLPWSRQIGLLGRQIAPRLYVAVAADGGYEHLTGSVKAQVIAAIDFERASPLLREADVGLAGHWSELLPELVEGLASAL
jgi:electron transfer flavoprotein alpha subunit